MATFYQLWTTLADDLGERAEFRATSTSGSGTAAREIISTTLIDSTLSASYYDEHYVYGLATGSSAVLAGQQRMIRQNGFNAATGTLSASRDFGSTPQSGHDWALVTPWPVLKHDRGPGLRDFINRALREIGATDFITISGVTDQLRYTLTTSTHWWLLEPGRIVQAWATPADATERTRKLDIINRIFHDGETIIVELKYGVVTGESFDLEVKRPANSRMKLSGTWADQTSPTAGLVLDADEILGSVPITDVVTAAKVHAYMAKLEQPGLGEYRAYWEGRLREQRQAAALVTFAKQAGKPPVGPRLSGNFDMGIFR